MVFGNKIDADYPDHRIREICHKLNVDVICLRDELHRSDYKPYDEHWNERGHRTVARTIEKIYKDKAALTIQMNSAMQINSQLDCKNPVDCKNEDMTLHYP